eukprot:500239_1
MPSNVLRYQTQHYNTIDLWQHQTMEQNKHRLCCINVRVSETSHCITRVHSMASHWINQRAKTMGPSKIDGISHTKTNLVHFSVHQASLAALAGDKDKKAKKDDAKGIREALLYSSPTTWAAPPHGNLASSTRCSNVHMCECAQSTQYQFSSPMFSNMPIPNAQHHGSDRRIFSVKVKAIKNLNNVINVFCYVFVILFYLMHLFLL